MRNFLSLQILYVHGNLHTMGVHDDSRNLTNSEHVAFLRYVCVKDVINFSLDFHLLGGYLRKGALSYIKLRVKNIFNYNF